MLDRPVIADLLQSLLAGIAEASPWNTFLHGLQAVLTADYVGLVLRPLSIESGGADHIHLHAGRTTPDIIGQLYRDRLHVSDPFPYLRMEDGRVYRLADLMRSGDPDHDDFRSRILAPSRMNFLRIMRIIEPSGVSAWLTVTREKAEFPPEADGLLGYFAPFLRAALASYVAIERERMTAVVAQHTIRRMNCGWLALNGSGQIVDSDGVDSLLLERVGLLSNRERRLTSTNPVLARELSDTFAALLRQSQPRPRAIVLSRDPWVDMLVIKSGMAPRAAGPAPMLIAYVHADDWSTTDRCEQLSQLFGLSPKEAQLSLSLSRGMSIAEAAVDMGITTETARTYSKKIYSKTGSSGQTDLVRLIHRSVLAFA